MTQSIEQIERWLPIDGYPGYEVSDFARVRSFWAGRGRAGLVEVPRMLKPEAGRNGYLRIGLVRDGRQKRFLLHRLVLTVFKGPAPLGMQGRHVDDHDRANCRLSNLAWGTPKQNGEDKVRHGTTARGDQQGLRKRPGTASHGESHHNAKLNAEKVRRIRSSKEPGRHLAHELCVSPSLISAVRNFLVWNHVESSL